jgi:mevalonate pyrophosphate decarboxylase
MASRIAAVPSRRLAFVLAAATAALAACGGGVWIGIGGGDDPPHVSLVASPASASAGQSVRLSAAASDDDFVDRVAFYRLDDNGNTVLLGEDRDEPYEWDTAMPSTVASSVRFVARAVDSIGQWTDSSTVSVSVLR